jgi:hypothetical protein
MGDVAVSNSQQRISSGSLGADVAMSGTSKSHDRTPKKVNRAAQQLGACLTGIDSWAMLCPGTNFHDFSDLSRTFAPISHNPSTLCWAGHLRRQRLQLLCLRETWPDCCCRRTPCSAWEMA